MAFKDLFKDKGLFKTFLGGIVGGPLGGFIVGNTQSEKTKSEEEISNETKALQESLANTKTYQTPEEAYKIQELAKDSAEKLRGISEIGQKSVDIAEAQSGMSQAPGTLQAKEDIKNTASQYVQNIIESGGGSASALGAIADVNRGEMESLRQISASNQQYRSQALKELQSSLMNQASLEYGLESQALESETYGLQNMLGEKTKEYNSYLDKIRTQQQFDITNLSNLYSSEEARKNRNTQLFGDIISGISGIGTSLFGG